MPDERKPEPNGYYCSDHCRWYDGKRCEILGFRPSVICEPHVKNLVAKVEEGQRLAHGCRVRKVARMWPALRLPIERLDPQGSGF